MASNSSSAAAGYNSAAGQQQQQQRDQSASPAVAGAVPSDAATTASATTTKTTGGRRQSAAAGGTAGAGGSGKQQSHSRSYPRGVCVDFRKVAGMTLLNYVDHHGVQVRPDAPPSELAVAVARHFEQMEVNEEECIGGFLERLESPSGMLLSNTSTIMTDYARKTAFFDGRAPPLAVRKRKRSKWAARPGEQVAAKVTRTDENGSWILASVQRFYSDTETYDVQDEDDTSKLIRLPWTHVMRLSTGTEGIFSTKPRGGGSRDSISCMAIFPETTSFYRAKVSKMPVWKLDKTASGGTGPGIPMVKEIIVKFEDDEDAQGRTPHRRVPARYVIPIPADYFYEEYEDVDLSLTTPTGGAAAAAIK